MTPEQQAQEWADLVTLNAKKNQIGFIDSSEVDLIELKAHAAGVIAEVASRGFVEDGWVEWPCPGMTTKDAWHVWPLKAMGQELPGVRQHYPLTMQVLDKVPGCFSACFSRLSPGAVIAPHSGEPVMSRHSLRVHLPLIVNGRAFLHVGEESVDFKVGEPVLFDDMQLHFAGNLSSSNRYTLIVDIMRPEKYPFKDDTTEQSAAETKRRADGVGLLMSALDLRQHELASASIPASDEETKRTDGCPS